MPPDPAAVRWKPLHDAIVASFDRDALEVFLSNELGVRLDEITGGGAFPTVAHDVIAWAKSHGREAELVRAVVTARPYRRERLRELAAAFGVNLPDTLPTATTATSEPPRGRTAEPPPMNVFISHAPEDKDIGRGIDDGARLGARPGGVASRPNTPTSRFDPPLVIAVHGIRTEAKWQKTFAEFLSQERVPCKLYDFGRYFWRFFRTASNEAMVDVFYDYYRSVLMEYQKTVDVNDYTRRPSIVAHSFGSYIVGYAMEKFEDIRFDKVLVCGSVLPRDFDWPLLIARDQVNLIRNEFGVKDFWTWVVRYFVARTGDGGHRGFDLDCSFFEQKRFEHYRHSDFFHRQHFDTFWLPFLRRTPSDLTIVHSRAIESDERLARYRAGARAMDKTSYGELKGYENVEIPYELPLRWLEINPDIFTYLIDRRDDTCKGYINAIPLRAKKFAQVKTGKCRDNSVAPADVLPYTPDENVRLYIMSIVTDAALRRVNTGLFNESFAKLVNGLCDKLVYYAVEKNIRVTEIAAVAWTDAGRRLCRTLGMSKIAKDEFGNSVYWVDLTTDVVQERRTIPGLARLLKVYRSHWNSRPPTLVRRN